MTPKLTECVAPDQENTVAPRRSKPKLALTVAVAVGVGVVALAGSAGNAYADGGTDSGQGPTGGQCPDGQCGAPPHSGGGSGCGSGCGWALVFGTTPGG